MTNDANNPAGPLSDLWCGSYTSDSNGHGTGISLIRTADDGTLLPPQPAVACSSPSFLAAHSALPVVYAVAESRRATQAYAIAGTDLLTPLGDPWAAGESVCHVTVDPAGRYAVATCWGDGTVHTYDLDSGGAIVASHALAPADDPYADLPGGVVTASNAAPRRSRAHASLVLPDGRVLTTDLGYDLARIWRYEPGASLVLDHEVALPAGSGPRHPVLHAGGAVSIVTEYSIEVVTLAVGDDGRYAVTDVAPVFAGGSHDGDAAAHITVDESGKHMHVTVRGANRVAVLNVHDGGTRLEPAVDVDCGGNWPRHHLQRGSFLHVANQLSDTITTFRLDAAGVPVELLQTLPAGSPTCLIPRR